jgi:superfamily II DNA or RNA helicase
VALAVIAARKQPTLIIVHTKELLQQWQERIKTFLGVIPGQIGAGKFDVRPITVAMVQTLRKRISEVSEYFGQVIVDECHRTPTATFSKCVQEVWAKYLLGLSATPFRRDGLTKYISISLGQTVHRVDPELLKDNGSVLRPEIETRETDFEYDYSDDYQAMISELTQDYDRNKQISRDIEIEAGSAGASLVVSDRIEHLQTLMDMTQLDGKALLTGSTPTRERERIVSELEAGNIKVLFSTLSLIGEGFDAPGLCRLFLATPIRFEGRLLQVIGRILRPQDGKTPIIFDYQDVCQPVLKAQARERNKVFFEVR